MSLGTGSGHIQNSTPTSPLLVKQIFITLGSTTRDVANKAYGDKGGGGEAHLFFNGCISERCKQAYRQGVMVPLGDRRPCF